MWFADYDSTSTNARINTTEPIDKTHRVALNTSSCRDFFFHVLEQCAYSLFLSKRKITQKGQWVPFVMRCSAFFQYNFVQGEFHKEISTITLLFNFQSFLLPMPFTESLRASNTINERSHIPKWMTMTIIKMARPGVIKTFIPHRFSQAKIWTPEAWPVLTRDKRESRKYLLCFPIWLANFLLLSDTSVWMEGFWWPDGQSRAGDADGSEEGCHR